MTLQYDRKAYMNRLCSHDDYFDQFVTSGIKRLVERSISRGKIKNSTDEHFNDIPLGLWDNLYGSIRTRVGGMLAKSNASTTAGGRGSLSLSDTVCVAKAAARQIRGF